jgi:hypothetical protein
MIPPSSRGIVTEAGLFTAPMDMNILLDQDESTARALAKNNL